MMRRAMSASTFVSRARRGGGKWITKMNRGASIRPSSHDLASSQAVSSAAGLLLTRFLE